MQLVTEKGYHLSIQQKYLWQVNQDKPEYFVLCQGRLTGALQVRIWQAALEELTAAHEILRTCFYRTAAMEVPVQVVTTNRHIYCPLINLEGLSSTEQSRQSILCTLSLEETSFDLSRLPLLRCLLLREGPGQHLFLFSLPALCADTVTPRSILTELLALYDILLAGKPVPAKEILQYVDVAAWQDELLAEEEVRQEIAYWEKIDLSSFPTTILPGEQRTPQLLLEKQNQAEERWSRIELPASLPYPPALQDYLQQKGISLEAFFLTCWQVVLWRLMGQSPLISAVECDGHQHEELHNLPGAYNCIVPISVPMNEQLTFERLLLLTQNLLREAASKQHTFAWTATQKTVTQQPEAIPPLFIYEEWPEQLQTSNLLFTLAQTVNRRLPAPLQMHVLRIGQKINLTVHFDQQRLTPSAIQRLATFLQTCYEQAYKRPHTTINLLPIMPSREEERLRIAYATPPLSFTYQTFAQVFEEQASLYPQNMAAVYQDEKLTYQELNSAANHLAHILQGLGVGAESIVGLYVERSVAMLIGLLGILKAGGAYLPLDSEQPPSRLLQQLQEAGTSLILTQAHLRSRLQAWPGKSITLADTREQSNSAQETQNPPRQNDQHSLAYIIYTSGSTGVSKGVMIRQRNLLNYIFALRHALAFPPGMQVATVSTLAADLGNTAIFCALATGGCVHVLDYETVISGEKFADYVAQHPLDLLKIVPSHLSALLAASNGRPILPRQYLILGGEILPFSLLQRLVRAGGTCQIINHYGPTEATIGALINNLGRLQDWHITHETIPDTAQSVPIGRPLPGVQAYILDPERQLVPIGVMGELYLAGAGLAAGYWQQAEQTQENFVPHPWDSNPQARLYRTGDLARYNEAGMIEFVGRSDSQVKLRGYRIELGEIEVTLARHPGVREKVVLLRSDPGEERCLVAYLILQTPFPTESDLRQSLQEQLPAFMLPSFFVFLHTFPLTTNGKIDRQRLAPPDYQRQEVSIQEEAEARTPIEEIVAGIWKTLLKVANVRLHDHFTRLGGHSLLAAQIIARIRHTLHVDIPLRDLFEFPTVASLSQRIAYSLQEQRNNDVMPPLIPVSREQALPLSFAQQRLWFLEQFEPGNTAYLIPRALRLRGKLQVRALAESIRALIQRHEILRTTFHTGEQEPIQIIHAVSTVVLPLIDLSGLTKERKAQEVQRLVSLENRQPCKLQQGPLLRSTLLRNSEDTHILLLTMHHIVSDAWSRSILFKELTTVYNAIVTRQSNPLPSLPVQYADFATWQRQWLQGARIQQQQDYWQQQLHNLSLLDLPTDFPRPAFASHHGTLASIMLPAALGEALKQVSQREGTTLFMTTLTAFQILLSYYSGQNDITIGTPIMQRSHIELEGLIGFFTNTLVIRSNLGGKPTIREALARCREVTLEAYAHQDIPFEKLVEILQPERDTSRTPLFQVMFILQHADQSSQQLADIAVDLLPYENPTAKFDLTLSVTLSKEGLYTSVEYNTDLFMPSTITRLLERWGILLEALTTEQDAMIHHLSLLTPTEHQQLLVTGSFPQQIVSTTQSCVHQLFEAQVVDCADTVAVSYGDEHLSYQALNTYSNQLAQHLRMSGASADTPVGICLERSPLMIVGILGILKAGCAYVPLDLSYPQERLLYMLDDTRTSILITQQHLLTEHFSHLSIHPLCLDRQWQEIVQRAPQTLQDTTMPDDLAYIMYTSGSTGRPKGIALPHQSLANLLQWHLASSLLSGVRTLQFASLSFDASFHEIFAALCSAGTVVMVNEATRHDSGELLRLLRYQACQKVILPVVVLQQLAESYSKYRLPDLREMTTTGEQLRITPVIAHFFQEVRQCTLHNHYGPAESHVVTAYTLPPDATDWPPLPPIGQPIANTQIFLLDRFLRPVPPGVPGELYIGGVSLARGYLNKPERTAERFIPHPLSSQEGERLYKTGDLARYQEDGTLLYLGRLDQQIKIRGHRIEPGEIEALLNQHPAVHEAVITVQVDQTDLKHLIAYVVSSEIQAELPRLLHEYLRKQVPDYMLPYAIVLLHALPTTVNGKIDLRALPLPDRLRPEREATFVSPRSPAEEVMAEVLLEVLALEQIGINDNFFDLGGHSLLATRAVSHLSGIFQVEIPVRHLFESPTIDGMMQQLVEIIGTREMVEEIAMAYQEIQALSDEEIDQQLLIE